MTPATAGIQDVTEDADQYLCVSMVRNIRVPYATLRPRRHIGNVRSMCVTQFWGDWWDAVALWRSGDPMDPAALCGYSILWWGRLGKILQFAAGLTVVLDLAGPERLRGIGQRAEERLGRTSLRALPSRVRGQFSSTQTAMVWVAAVPAWLFGVALPFYWMQVTVLKWDRAFAFWASLTTAASIALIRVPRVGWFLCVSISVAVYVVGYVKHGMPDYDDMAWWQKGLLSQEGSDYLFLVGALIALVAGVVLFGILAGALIIVLSLATSLYLVTVMGVSRSAEWTLNNANPGHALRYAAFALFLLGFHFDLLAS
ncbi:hypothetical protein [Actinoplanes sp. NPDC048796]|uniref:hypothetical protein n=1 Tax=unclassified Actinoplanes TaxID=2626549 RepID=UPI0033EED4B0